MTKNLLDKYMWLLDLIYKREKITFEEINKEWVKSSFSEGENLPLRTFQNHRQSIKELFNINIDCNRKGKYYYHITNIPELLDSPTFCWFLHTFSINHIIQQKDDSLKERVIFKEAPLGSKYISSILEAMRSSKLVKMTYTPFGKDKVRKITIAPLMVKVFQDQWYMLTQSYPEQKIAIFMLDRISQLSITEENFNISEKLNLKFLADHCYGITIDPEGCLETIEIKVLDKHNKRQRFIHYPLHPTQKETHSYKDYSIFTYELFPTYEFVQEVLSLGPEVEILSPKWLREECKKLIEEMYNIYQTIL